MKYIKDNLWTWAGTGLALITLSGVTQQKALLIAGAAVIAHTIITHIIGNDE